MEKKNYHFQPGKESLKQGYILTDDSENILYDAKKIKSSLFGPTVFEFTNHVTGISGQHDVGRTVTIDQGNDLYTVTTSSYFKFDGQNIWDCLRGEGVHIETSMTEGRLGLIYRVLQNDREIAVIETARMEGLMSFMSSGTSFEVLAVEDDLDTVFLTAFAIARTGKSSLEA